MSTQGTIYLLHFDRPFKHARHYTGWTADLEARLDQHSRGLGARLLSVVKANGIEWSLARTWTGDRGRERALKNQGGAARRCPMCRVRPPAAASPAAEAAISAAGPRARDNHDDRAKGGETR